MYPVPCSQTCISCTVGLGTTYAKMRRFHGSLSSAPSRRVIRRPGIARSVFEDEEGGRLFWTLSSEAWSAATPTSARLDSKNGRRAGNSFSDCDDMSGIKFGSQTCQWVTRARLPQCCRSSSNLMSFAGQLMTYPQHSETKYCSKLIRNVSVCYT